MRHCPDCHTDQVIKNGSNGTGKPKYACQACGRQFVDDPAWRVISDDTTGARDEATACHLWQSLPPVYRQCAVERARPVGKDSGQTSHIERLNNTLRPHISRLIRRTLSFSKKLENHIGAIWCFVHHWNASLA